MIYKPIRPVFDFVSTPENDFQWQYEILAASKLSENASRMGSFFRSIGHFMGQRIQGTFEVTEYEPDRKYGFKSLSGPLHSQTSYTFKVNKGSTKVSISTQAQIGDFFQMNERTIEQNMKKQMKENLALLKELLEAKPIPSAAANV
jgi:hypothetical protein